MAADHRPPNPPRTLHVASGNDEDEERPRGKTLDDVIDVMERWADNAAKAATRIDQIETQLTAKITTMAQGIRLELLDIKEHLGFKPKSAPEAVAPRWREGWHDEDSSHHEFDPEVKRFRENMRESVKDPKSPIDEERATALIRQVNDQIEHDRARDRAAGKWNALTALPGRMFVKATESAAGVISHGLLAAIAAGLVFLWHYLSTRGR